MSEQQQPKRKAGKFGQQLCVRLSDAQIRKLEKIRRMNKFDSVAQALRFVITELH